jgi:rhodanese-related sulfurtransferase
LTNVEQWFELEITADRLDVIEGRYLIDIREREETDDEPVSVDLLMPMSIFDERKLPVDRPLVLVCAHGIRSLYLTKLLRAHGHPNVVSLRGGVEAMTR